MAARLLKVNSFYMNSESLLLQRTNSSLDISNSTKFQIQLQDDL